MTSQADVINIFSRAGERTRDPLGFRLFPNILPLSHSSLPHVINLLGGLLKWSTWVGSELTCKQLPEDKRSGLVCFAVNLEEKKGFMTLIPGMGIEFLIYRDCAVGRTIDK